MRNKNTFITLLVIFAAICVYHLTLTVLQFQDSSRLEAARKAAVVAESKPDSLRSAKDSSAIEAYNKLLNDREFQDGYDRKVKNSFNLGLDLQGGMFVTLEVGVDAIVRQLAGTSADSTFEKAMKLALDRQNAGEQKSFVALFDAAMLEVAPNAKLGTYFANAERKISYDTPREKVLEMLNKESEDAIDRTFNIIRTRVDQFGVVSPNLQKQPGTGRILLELPGVKDPDRVRKLLRSTAKLEFWETHTIGDAYKALQAVNEKVKQIKGIALADTTAKDSASAKDSTGKDTLAGDTTAADSNLSQDEQRAKYIRENPFLSLIQFPDPNSITENSPVVGYAVANDTAKISGYLRMDAVKTAVPSGMKFAWTFKPLEGTENIYTLVALKANLEGGAALGGEAVSSARQNFDETGRAIVEMGMNAEGADAWARLTGANIGKSVAILLDGYVYSFPTVQNKISGGNSQITGNFTIEEAKDLANVLKAGQLPVPARIEGEDVVGPSLGAQNIGFGLMSFGIALLLTFAFMWWYYAKAGMYANIALIINMIFLLGMSAGFNIVLTMSGIAAIVLTIGMAVDANVLIYERIREELTHHNKTLKAGIKSGFSNAFSSIVDANVTTFLTGAVLYIFGVGPIKGFAVSLMIGIVTTLISGLLITRFIMEYFADKGGNSISFGNAFTLKLFSGLKLNFLGVKKRWYIISGTLVGLSLLSIAIFGFKLGVDFQGGRQFTYTFTQQGSKAAYKIDNNTIEKVRSELTAAFKGVAPVIKTLASDNQLQITTSYLSSDRAATERVEELIKAGFAKVMPNAQATRMSIADVGPTVAADIKEAALQSVIGSLVMIFLYVLLRFRKWQYSLGGIVALFHDVIITLGVFSFLGGIGFQYVDVEMNQNLIAALLTIIGFSINDTVVVFDRIRENVNLHKGMALGNVYDLAIDETLSRTIITSLTVFLTTLVLFIFGGDSIRGFVFAFMIGVIVGTYSSIFVASGISYDMQERSNRKKDSGEAPVAA